MQRYSQRSKKWLAATSDGVEPCTADMRLVEDLELDSLKALTLAVEVENRFQICLDPEIEAGIVTLGDLVEAVRSSMELARMGWNGRG